MIPYKSSFDTVCYPYNTTAVLIQNSTISVSWPVQVVCIQSRELQSPLTGSSIPFARGDTFPQISSPTSSRVLPASITTHFSAPISFPILPKISRTRACISGFSYRSSPYPSRCSAACSGEMSRKMVRSGAGRDTSGALHHSYVNGQEEEEGFWSSAFDAENAIPENAYLSQITVVPDSSRDLICELRTRK